MCLEKSIYIHYRYNKVYIFYIAIDIDISLGARNLITFCLSDTFRLLIITNCSVCRRPKINDLLLDDSGLSNKQFNRRVFIYMLYSYII